MEEDITKRKQTEDALPEERVEQTECFQDLIRGKYREDYLKALSEALCAQARETNRYLAYRELQAKLEGVRAQYPDFDPDRELENPAFACLLNSGVEPLTAYEVVHHRELSGRAARMAENAARPQEKNPYRSVLPDSKPDPRTLTRQERKALRRRAARGEEIIW